MSYVAVDDVRATFDRALALDASPIAPPMDVPGVGSIAIIKDPTGAVIALARLDPHPGTSPALRPSVSEDDLRHRLSRPVTVRPEIVDA
jgi:hypothetical protein